MKEGKILIETAEKVNYISEYIVAYKANLQTVVLTEIRKWKCSKTNGSIC